MNTITNTYRKDGIDFVTFLHEGTSTEWTLDVATIKLNMDREPCSLGFSGTDEQLALIGPQGTVSVKTPTEKCGNTGYRSGKPCYRLRWHTGPHRTVKNH